RVGVLGMGRTGLAAARALGAGGAEVVCWDDGAQGRAMAEGAGFALVDFSRPGAFDGMAVLIVSPGIAHLYPTPNAHVAAAMAAGVPLDNDIGLFFRSFGSGEWERFETPPRVIAVTGSNGKSTTSALIAHVLRETGRDVQFAGNIGTSVLDIEPPQDGGVVVLELSSYQIELARALTPDIAVFTNLVPDHLERHGGMGGYFAAKRRLFSEGGPDRAIIGIDEPEGRILANQMAEGTGDTRVIRVSTSQKLGGAGWSVHARKGFLSETRAGRQAGSIDLRAIKGLPGGHNHQNACAAYGALRALHLAPKEIAGAFETFEGLPHRSQHVADKDGIAILNDSKATNADAAFHALMAFDKIRWIVGGQMKQGGIAALEPALSRVVKAYIIGRETDPWSIALKDVDQLVAGNMDVAVAAAIAEAKPGETILLAPAAASFDQFDNFEARGDAFVAAVRAALSQE
ncbi:MAG: UDP-N-acetylmuramoyl-L-alanine--D-glutamate ligase, partial [Pseudomonadota bacterium]